MPGLKAHAIRFAARAERDLDKLPDKVASACVAFIFGPLSQDPYKLGTPLVLHIDHRAHVYRR